MLKWESYTVACEKNIFNDFLKEFRNTSSYFAAYPITQSAIVQIAVGLLTKWVLYL